MLTLGAGIAGQRRQQRRAGDADLRVGLNDLGDRDRDVEIVDLRRVHQRGQLAGPEATPPIQRGNGRVGVALRRRAIGRGHVEIELGPFGSEDAAG